MKKLILLASLTTLLVMSTIPALAQEVDLPSGVTTDQYGPSGGPTVTSEQAAEEAVRDIVRKGEDVDGATAYEAALNAAREAGADKDTSVVVAAEAVSDVSEITELPATGGAPVSALGAGLLMVGAGLLTRRLLL